MQHAKHNLKLPLYSRQLALVLYLFGFFVADAQKTENYTYPASNVVTIHSNILNEDRRIFVHSPKLDSINLNKRFPVLYLMDGDNHFELICNYVDYLSRPDVLEIPKIIVVGITNTNRTRDLTPTNSILDYDGKPNNNSYKLSGGNQNFLQFIETELMPVIEKNYNTDTNRIFAGHSFGGLSAINCMLNHPNMFNTYIAVSPSLWWDKASLLKMTELKLKTGTKLNKTFFFSDGNEGGPSSFFHKDLLKMKATIGKKKLKGFNYLYKHYPAESHMTVPVVSYYDALRFIFKNQKAQ